MRTICFLLYFALTSFFGCKHISTESQESKKKHEVKDLNYHLSNGLTELDNHFGIEQKFTDEVYLRGFSFYEKAENHYALILELQDDITEDVVSKYTFAVEGFVGDDELNNLSDYALNKNRTHDAWFGTPELIKVNNHCYVILDITTKLNNFELLKFFLFDKDGYSGDIGKRILFYNYSIE